MRGQYPVISAPTNRPAVGTVPVVTDLVVPEEIPASQLAAVLAPLGSVADATLLTGGMFATTYRVTLGTGQSVVVKTAPAGSERLLEYERDLLRTEALVYTLAADVPQLPVPRVLHTDFSRAILPRDVVVASWLDGTVWAGTTDLDDAAASRVRRELGTVMAHLHSITGDVFGYPQNPDLQAATWRGAFTAMVEGLLRDAARWGTPLPVDRVRAVLVRHGSALDAVEAPRLVHTDLWPGNVFIEPSSGRITGIIDPERAVWGDPLLELAGADQMGRGPVPVELIDGYRDGGGDLGLGRASNDVRLLLYRMYMSLVLQVEIAPRAYVGEWLEGHRTVAEGCLVAALEALEAA